MTSIYAQKVTVAHQVVHTMNNSTTLIGVVKGGQLGKKGRSLPHVKFSTLKKQAKNFLKRKFDILIYKKETVPGTLLHFQLIMITHESFS
jgi:hypothetical protein